MKVTVDIDPTNVGSVFGSVKKALSDYFEVAKDRESNVASNLFHAMDIFVALENIYSSKSTTNFYHYLGKFMEILENDTAVLPLAYKADPEKNYCTAVAEHQYGLIITESFSKLAELAYICSIGIENTEMHEKALNKSYLKKDSSQKEDASGNAHKSECTEEEHATINDLLIHVLREEFKDGPDVKIYIKTKGEI